MQPLATAPLTLLLPPRSVGLGCMRLSTEVTDHDHAIAVIHAALDAGVRLLDTADVYGPTAADTGHNERLVARALATWPGDRSAVIVATKGGLVRRGARWLPDGRGTHLKAACAASRAALGVEAVDLYLLHAPDPRTPLATSVKALRALLEAGQVRALGLSNVTVAQLDEACALAPISAVEVELGLGPLGDGSVRGGVVERCRDRGIRVLAHRPFGGVKARRKLERDPALAAVAARLGVSPQEAALAWLFDLDPSIVPLAGATRVDSARSIGRVAELRLDERDRSALDRSFGFAALFRRPRAARQPADDAAGEVVLLMGSPAAGKTEAVASFVDRGYRRLNRDRDGGRLADLVPALDRGLGAGEQRFVLDNTYATRRSRNLVIETAWAHGVPVRCVWLQTSLDEAMVNACERMIARHRRLLTPDEMKHFGRTDPNSFPPRALYDYRDALEPPVVEEGFTRVDAVPFVRRVTPERKNRALVVQLEAVLDERGELSPERAARLRALAGDGRLLLALAWQPATAHGDEPSGDHGAMRLAAMGDRLGADATPRRCPHPAGPPTCWCRPPLPGLAVELIVSHALDPSECTLVGSGAPSRLLAARVGFAYAEASDVVA